MESFTLIDGIVALIIVLSALLAYSRGLIRELMAILGWIAAAVLAYLFAASVVPLVRQIPAIGDRLADSCELSLIAGFGAIFALVLVGVSLFTPLFSSVVHRSVLGGPDRALGFFFGVLRGILLVAAAFFAYGTILQAQDIAMIDSSRSAKVFGNMLSGYADEDPSVWLEWITDRYDGLVASCAVIG